MYFLSHNHSKARLSLTKLCLFQHYSSMLLLWCAFLLSPCHSQTLTTLQLPMTLSQTLTETLVPSPSLTALPLTTVVALPSISMISIISENSTSTESRTLVPEQTDDIISATPLPSSSIFFTLSQSPMISSRMQVQTTFKPTVNTSRGLQLSTTMTASVTQSISPSLSSTQLPSPSSSLIVTSNTPSGISMSPSNSSFVSLPPVPPSPSVQSDLVSATSSVSVSITSAMNINTIPVSMTPTPTQTERPTVNIVGTGMKTEVIVGIIIAITIFAAILLAVVTLSCYICCRTKKYEYNTGNEYRVTVQHWKANSDHYTANRSESASLSSSRGSSFMSSFGLKPKIRPRYGSSPADRVTTVVNPEFFYSTPL